MPQCESSIQCEWCFCSSALRETVSLAEGECDFSFLVTWETSHRFRHLRNTSSFPSLIFTHTSVEKTSWEEWDGKGLTCDDRAGRKVSAEQIHVQRRSGEDELQRGDALKNITQLGEQEVGQSAALVHLILWRRSHMHCSHLLSQCCWRGALWMNSC